jgi:thymidylate synthase (FAD)
LNESGLIPLCKAIYDIDPELVYNEEMRSVLETYQIQGKVTVIDLSDLENLTENEFMNHFYMTFHYITDRGVTHEMVRHRPASYAQESTRYCNYVKEQFGSELTFCKPTQWDTLPDHIKFHYIRSWEDSESNYDYLIRHGQTPQQARAVLPNALKTEIIMTACAGELEHFFNLRSRGVTGAPHPDIKTVADKALEMYEVEKYWLLGALPF